MGKLKRLHNCFFVCGAYRESCERRSEAMPALLTEQRQREESNGVAESA